MITISGSTQDYITDTAITVKVISPIGNIVKFDQIALGADRTYSTTEKAAGPLWSEAGTYQVFVQFGSKDRTAQTTFQFTGSGGGQAQSGNTMKVDGTDLSVQYSITNGKVLGIKADVQSKSLIVSIQTTGDGVLTVTLPRGLIDAQVNGQDDHFYVLNDGQEADFQETGKTTTDRTLSIPFTDGTQEIEIIGTQIIPEFGPIAALVLAIAIISIIAVSAKTGLRFMPKY
jgi:predicted secreted protein with PEFG-CTERM motif